MASWKKLWKNSMARRFVYVLLQVAGRLIITFCYILLLLIEKGSGLPSRELTYPTNEKGNSSSQLLVDGICITFGEGKSFYAILL